MGHYGKHIIDPETGLCEICDRNAIQEVHQGKRLDQQVVYPNNAAPYGQEQFAHGTYPEPTGSYIRKTAVPSPVARPRRVIYEGANVQPVGPRRIIQRPSPRSSVVYVDQDNQMLPSYNSPTPRTVRVVHQYAQTPPPPASEMWHAGPRRQTNSGVEIIQRQPRIGPNGVYYQQTTPRTVGPHYVKAGPNLTRHPSLSSTVHVPRVYQIDGNRKQYRVEPIQRRIYTQPEPTVIRRVYKKLPPGRYEPMVSASFIEPPPVQPPPPPVPQPPPVKEPIVYHIRLTD